jgi:hypothetical protein
MITFLEIDDGSCVPSSEIVKIQNHTGQSCTISLKSGEKFVVDQSRHKLMERLYQPLTHTFPASPGYFVVFAENSPNDQLRANLMPVIGWQTMVTNFDRGFFFAVPIVASYEPPWSRPWALLHPDGTVNDRKLGERKNIQEWLATVDEFYFTGKVEEKKQSKKKKTGKVS